MANKKKDNFFSKNILGVINDVPDELVDPSGGENELGKRKIEELEKKLKVAQEEKAALEIIQDTKEIEMKNTMETMKKQQREMELRIETLEIEKQTLRKAADNSKKPSVEQWEATEAIKRENGRMQEQLFAMKAENNKLMNSSMDQTMKRKN